MESFGTKVFMNRPIVLKLSDWENRDKKWILEEELYDFLHTFYGILVNQFTTIEKDSRPTGVSLELIATKTTV